MQSEQMWIDDAVDGEPQPLTRRGALKLAGAGALALTLAGAVGQARFAGAQEATPPAAEGTGEVEGDIQVGTTEDAAAGAQVEGEAEAGAADEQTREERRAAREAEEAAVGGGTTVGTVPSTGVGSVLGPSLGGAIGAIGLAAASVTAAILTRRDAFFQRGTNDE